MIYSNKHNISVFNRKLYDEYGDYDEYDNQVSMLFLEVFVAIILYILLLCGVVIIQTCCCVFFKSVCDCFSTRVHPNKFANNKENIRKRQNKTISRIRKAICRKKKKKTKKNKSNVLKKKKIKIIKVRKKSEMYKCKENNKSGDTYGDTCGDTCGNEDSDKCNEESGGIGSDLQKKYNKNYTDVPIDSENINIVIQ